MAENSWAERRGRMVKCKIHGLHYDPEMSTGCTLCLRDAAKAGRPSRPPQLVLILLCLLGMAAILLYIFRPGQGEATGIIDLGVASNPAVTVTKLDPEPYRGQIQALETALFRTPLDETEDLLVASSNVRAATDDLSSAILRSEPIDGLTTADLIARIGQGVPADQVVLTDIQRARDQWTRLRKQRFLSADWFTEPSAAGAVPDTTAADFSSIAASVLALIEDGAVEVETLNDPGLSTGGDDGFEEDDSALRWRTFARDWLDQLKSLQSRLPARPGAGAAGNLLVAIQDLEQAMRLARSLATSNQLPSVTDSRFDDGISAALRAQQNFDDIAP